MRGRIDRQGEIFHTFNLEDLVPAGHPPRAVKIRADNVLAGMSRRFDRAYAKVGRKGVPPEQRIKALLLQALYSIRSEIQVCEQISYNMLYRWFLDMNPSDAVWTPEDPGATPRARPSFRRVLATLIRRVAGFIRRPAARYPRVLAMSLLL